MKGLEIVNGAEVKRKDLQYILKINLMIPVWMLRMRKKFLRRGNKKEEKGKKEKGRGKIGKP